MCGFYSYTVLCAKIQDTLFNKCNETIIGKNVFACDISMCTL